MKPVTLKRSHYDNVIILSKEGVPLSTVSNRKARWYLKKDLGNEVPTPEGLEYPRAIKLNFVAEVSRPRFQHDLTICKDECVMCGRKDNLTVHHVVPHVIRKHFPIEHKSRARQWCVLMCYKHHMALEDDLKQLYYGPCFPHDHGREDKTNMALSAIKRSGNLYRVPPNKLQDLLSKSDYKTIDEIPILTSKDRDEIYRTRTLLHRDKIRQWALKYIEDHDGVEGTKQFFREHFLSKNPKHLPNGWLEDRHLS